MSYLIKNALIVNARGQEKQTKDILIEKGVIANIAPSIKAAGVKEIDAQGKYVLPGLVDLHVHLREPGREDKETIETGCRAAVKGGFTSIFCMPNTTPVLDNAMVIEAVLKEVKRVGLCHVYPIGAVTKGQNDQELSDIYELKKAGCLAISDDGKSVLNSQLMRMALTYAQTAGVLVIEHCQDEKLTGKGVMNEGASSTILGLKGDPGISETVMIARNIEIAHYLSTRIHFAHVSLKRSVELIRMAKKQGIQVTAEACPHHFSLTDEMLKTFNTSLKVNPPLRSAEDVQAIKKGLADGTLDCIASDHAPHTFEDKEVDFDHAPFGMIGLETSFGLTVSELVDAGFLSWPQLVEKMSYAPARLVGLEKKGEIAQGCDADIVIVDPKAEWEVKKSEIRSKSKNSPFIGRTLKGKIETTICNGKVVYQA